jgi:hypothetical protein
MNLFILAKIILALNQVGFSQIYAIDNNNGFGFFCVGKDVPLAIELINFSTNVQNSWVKLKWQSTSEKNNDYLLFEKWRNESHDKEMEVIEKAGNERNTFYLKIIL